MASLDVTDALEDPEFGDCGYYLRSMQAANSSGVNQLSTPTPVKFFGSFQTDSGDSVERGPDGTKISGNITVITKTRLRAGSKGVAADIVIWPGSNGDQYTVMSVKPYSNYGAGFVEASCELIPMVPM